MIAEEEVVERARVDAPPRGVRRWICLAVLTVMLLAVTKGPVYWIRGERAAWTGDPIDPRSACEMTVINGRIVYDASEQREF